MTDEEFQNYLDSTFEEMEEKQNKLEQVFGLGHFDRYELDPDEETIFFSADGKNGVKAKFIPIGTYSLENESWMWGWHNSAFTDGLREKSGKLKALADITGIEMFENPTAGADEEMAWEMAAMSLHVLDADGLYRVPGNNLLYFYAIYDIEK